MDLEAICWGNQGSCSGSQGIQSLSKQNRILCGFVCSSVGVQDPVLKNLRHLHVGVCQQAGSYAKVTSKTRRGQGRVCIFNDPPVAEHGALHSCKTKHINKTWSMLVISLSPSIQSRQQAAVNADDHWLAISSRAWQVANWLWKALGNGFSCQPGSSSCIEHRDLGSIKNKGSQFQG